MAEIKWIKICTDIFDDEKILLIEGLPESDSIIVIWFKLLCMAGKQNNSGVFMLNDKIAYTDEMLATIFRRPLNTVRLALKTFQQYGMIEIVNDTITIPNWEKHQSLEKLEMSKEKTRIRVQRYRERQKLLAEGNNCNALQTRTVTESNADRIRIEEEEDKEKDNIYSAVIARLNEKAGTKYKASTAATRRHINARLDEGYTLENFCKVIDKKCAEWKGTEMEKYLRPETLFGTKFENYLNAPADRRKSYGANGVEIKPNSSGDLLDGIL